MPRGRPRKHLTTAATPVAPPASPAAVAAAAITPAATTPPVTSRRSTPRRRTSACSPDAVANTYASPIANNPKKNNSINNTTNDGNVGCYAPINVSVDEIQQMQSINNSMASELVKENTQLAYENKIKELKQFCDMSMAAYCWTSAVTR